MHLISWHGTLIAKSSDSNLYQVPLFPEDKAFSLLDFTLGEISDLSDPGLHDAQWTGVLCTGEPALENSLLFKEPGGRFVSLKRDDFFLSAQRDIAWLMEWNRPIAREWEKFLLVSTFDLENLKRLISKGEAEILSGFRVFLDGLSLDLPLFLDQNSRTAGHGGTFEEDAVADYGEIHSYSTGVDATLDPETPEIHSDDRAQRVISAAKRLLNLGSFDEAFALLDSARSEYKYDDEFLYYWRFAYDRINYVALGAPTIIARTNFDWEKDWLEEVFPALKSVERRDKLDDLAGLPIVVVDNRITGEKIDFYRNAFEIGCRVMLIHLSDEEFLDDHRVYRWCKSVFRNCYSPVLKNIPNVEFFALGYKSGFSDGSKVLPYDARDHVWSFAGDPNKTTRKRMLAEMRKVAGGAEHLISGFAAPDSLDTESYRYMMRNSLFVPCPQGFVNLDSFRVYEALEAGCIPIVERLPRFDYFYEMLGPYPFPAVYDWQEASSLIAHLQGNGLTEALLSMCGQWWGDYKRRLKVKLGTALLDL